MGSEEKLPPRGSGDRIEWFTVSYRTITLAGGAIVLLGALGWLQFCRTPAPTAPATTPVEVGARFASIEGSVDVKRAGTLEWRAATTAVVLRQNDLVRTGASATAEILFADGMHINVRPDTLITIVESSQNPVSRQQRNSLAVQSGEANFQTAPRAVPGSTTITTPTVRTTPDRDTAGNIQVNESGETDLRFFKGQGEAETRSGQRIALGTNQGVKVDAGGTAGPTVNLPNVPQLTAPPNRADIAYEDLPGSVTLLVWNAVPGAASYRVMVDYGPTFARPLFDRRVDQRATQLDVRGLEASSYYWKVAALDARGSEGSFSETWLFTLARAPAKPASPPPLAFDGAELKGNILHVRGRTEPGANLTLNGERLEVQADGSFNEFLTFEGGPGATVVLRATTRKGGTVEERRRVTATN
jgi:hypothetical protein